MNYSQLNPTQQTQAQFLFADSIFGVVSSTFNYEVDKGGNVTGRTPLGMEKSNGLKGKAGSTPRLEGLPAERITAEEYTRMDAVITQMADLIASMAYELSISAAVEA